MNELEIEKNEKRNEKFIQEFKAWLKKTKSVNQNN